MSKDYENTQTEMEIRSSWWNCHKPAIWQKNERRDHCTVMLQCICTLLWQLETNKLGLQI